MSGVEYLGLVENTALVPEYRWVWVDVFLLKLRKFKTQAPTKASSQGCFELSVIWPSHL